eukprot:9936171-Alexandrium_andersonii.AAC.1
MSASLVGSEMCIRDRAKGAFHMQRPFVPDVGHGDPHNDTSMTTATGTLATVSYTHLTLPTICSV